MDLPAEVSQLKDLIELKDKEIESLRQQVESNPIAAERHAKVAQLEAELKKMAKANGLNTSGHDPAGETKHMLDKVV